MQARPSLESSKRGRNPTPLVQSKAAVAAPTVAIEIVSPDQSVSDLRRKCVFYRERGVDVCWLVEPEARWVEVWDASRDGLRLAAGEALSAVELPGFDLAVETLWRALDSAPD